MNSINYHFICCYPEDSEHCIIFNLFDLSCDKCQLEFDVQNATDHELHVEYSTSGSVSLNAGQCKRSVLHSMR